MTPSDKAPPPSGPVSRLANLLMWIGALAMIAMMLHICVDVIARKTLGAPIVGTLEFVTYLYMISVVFLPLAVTQLGREHVIVEVFSQFLPARQVARLDLFALLLAAVYIAFITWWGMQEALRATARNEVIAIVGWDVPLWPTRWIMVAGLGAMLLAVLAQILSLLRARPNSQEHP